MYEILDTLTLLFNIKNIMTMRFSKLIKDIIRLSYKAIKHINARFIAFSSTTIAYVFIIYLII